MSSSSESILVCSDCKAALSPVAFDLDEVEPISIGLGHTCEAHLTASRPQAQHRILVDPDALQQRAAAAAAGRVGASPFPYPSLVATIAGQLLTGLVTATDGEIEAATDTARRIVAEAAKG